MSTLRNNIFKAVSIFTISYMAAHSVPIMGDSVATQSVALLKRSKEPIFQKSAARRMNSIATNDERRRFLISHGGIRALFNALGECEEESILFELAKTLANLLQCDEAVHGIDFDFDMAALNQAMSIVKDENTLQLLHSASQKLQQWNSST